MTNAEMIEMLKDKSKARPLGLLSKEEQGILTEAGRYNCLYYDWRNTWIEWHENTLYSNNTYILKPDYRPEPEYVEIEVVVVGNGVLMLKRPSPNARYQEISNIVGDKDFHEFKDNKTGVCTKNPGSVPAWKREGHKVYARFVKE